VAAALAVVFDHFGLVGAPAFTATIAGLFAMAPPAGYIPAVRASRVDPMTALRTD
jgi:ABC-type antimicrobial peptide transport system permease subunit